MTTIKLLDARRELYFKCRDLFGNEKIAELIYRYLCDGIEECEDAEPERKTGRWEKTITHYPYCSICEWMPEEDEMTHGPYNFCPNCGAKMEDNNGE